MTKQLKYMTSVLTQWFPLHFQTQLRVLVSTFKSQTSLELACLKTQLHPFEPSQPLRLPMEAPLAGWLAVTRNDFSVMAPSLSNSLLWISLADCCWMNCEDLAFFFTYWDWSTKHTLIPIAVLILLFCFSVDEINRVVTLIVKCVYYCFTLCYDVKCLEKAV